ncbi:MAG: hypothetical protein KAH54_10930 [Candidatus Sabulitectum sp.]|nr:hypothetical protein [Candidatus Sabulitectum sp.]
MNLRTDIILFLAASLFLLFSACGSGEALDSEGLAFTGSASEQFTRASQLYYRGRLTAAMEEFNGVIYRYPDSPFASDARLALRRVESDLNGQELQGNTTSDPVVNASIAVVGKPGVNTSILSVGSALRNLGAGVTEITDDQAPEFTVVFYSEGYGDAASIVADSLDRWLSHPEGITPRAGDELIGSVASGYDVLVIVGSDAVFTSSF